jgi:nucleoid-associated protein YgaU
MHSQKSKIKLAPRLRWGVGRDTNKFNFYKLGSILFSFLAFGLIVNAVWQFTAHKNSTPKLDPQVLGEVDNQQSNQVFIEYKVKSGDTLFTIARDYNVEWTTLATINKLEAPFRLQVGQSIKIPKQ